MKKVILLGDIHIGARSDSLLFAEYHISFFEKQLFPYMLKNDINRIIQFGDVFDRRKFVNFQILDMWKRRVFDWLLRNNIEVDVIAGNHDVYYKNTNDVNSPVLLLREYSNINVFIQPTETFVGSTTVLYVPWINQTNEASTLDAVKKTKATIAFGHFEFKGLQMDKGSVVGEGMSTDKFKKFDAVYSGHYHHRNDNGHVFYLGTPYQLTWVDFGSKKGFHVWDPDKLTTKFIKNDDEMFIMINYDDSKDPDEYWKGFDLSGITNRYIKIIVVNKKNLYGFDQLLSKIYAKNPGDVKIIENMIDIDSGDVEEDLNLEDTSKILDNYVDTMETSLDKDKLKRMLKHLYVQALHMETA